MTCPPRAPLARRELLAAAPALVLGSARGGWQVLNVEQQGARAAVHVYLPAGYSTAKLHPLVVALHGWNHSPELWRQKSDLGPLADRYGCVVAMPAMGKTVYETKFYPETRSSWRVAPGTPWVAETVLPHLRRNFAVYGDRAHTAALGYSTGGRGAVLLAQAYASFGFAGSASGTYDLRQLSPSDGEYKIHAAMYGPRDEFPARWELDNCLSPARLERLDGVRLYVSHGERDTVVAARQMVALREALAGRSGVEAAFALVPGAGHDWAFWSSQWQPMFEAAAPLWASER